MFGGCGVSEGGGLTDFDFPFCPRAKINTLLPHLHVKETINEKLEPAQR